MVTNAFTTSSTMGHPLTVHQLWNHAGFLEEVIAGLTLAVFYNLARVSWRRAQMEREMERREMEGCPRIKGTGQMGGRNCQDQDTGEEGVWCF